MLKLTNTATRAKEAFTPITPGHVTVYTCGPTVYDYAHIGNLRAFLFYDLLIRVLRMNELSVKRVMNITDVGHLTDDADAGEDKMEKGAAREGRTVWEIAEHYIEAFHADMQKLNMLLPDVEPRATDHIQEQIDLIHMLEERGFTYAISDGVYFDTSRFADYGAMAQLDVEGQQEGARVEANEEKRNATDFALWKFSPTGEKRAMEWESPWGTGFPGWHLECSAMAMKYLGNTMDIHTGGVDHIQTHHTNEIAQSEAATGEPFSHWWLHNEHLLVDNKKMSKSAGNFYTLADLAEKGFSPLAFRYAVLSAHYRSKMNFTLGGLEAAQQALNKLVYRASSWVEETGYRNEDYWKQFEEAMNDDLNTPAALAVLWEMMKSDLSAGEKWATLENMEEVLGIPFTTLATELRRQLHGAGTDFEAKLTERETARAAKDYDTADRIRDEIATAGFIIEDTEDGPIVRPQ